MGLPIERIKRSLISCFRRASHLGRVLGDLPYASRRVLPHVQVGVPETLEYVREDFRFHDHLREVHRVLRDLPQAAAHLFCFREEEEKGSLHYPETVFFFFSQIVFVSFRFFFVFRFFVFLFFCDKKRLAGGIKKNVIFTYLV